MTGTVAGDYHIEVRGYEVASAYHLDLDAPLIDATRCTSQNNRDLEGVVKEIPSEPLSVDVPDDTAVEAPCTAIVADP